MSKKEPTREEVRAKLKDFGERWQYYHDEFTEWGQILVGPADVQPAPRQAPKQEEVAATNGEVKKQVKAKIKRTKAKRKK